MKLFALYECISEGIFGDMLKVAGASLPQKLQDIKYAEQYPRMKQLVLAAADADYSLLDVDKSLGWWEKLFDAASIDKPEARTDLLKAIIKEIEPHIDMTAEKRAEALANGQGEKPIKESAIDTLKALFRKNPPGPDASKTGKEWLQLMIDLMNSNKRSVIVPRLVKKANNQRIAMAAINYLANHLIKNGANREDPFAQATPNKQSWLTKGREQLKNQGPARSKKEILTHHANNIRQLIKQGKRAEASEQWDYVRRVFGYELSFENRRVIARKVKE